MFIEIVVTIATTFCANIVTPVSMTFSQQKPYFVEMPHNINSALALMVGKQSAPCLFRSLIINITKANVASRVLPFKMASSNARFSVGHAG